MRWTVGTKIAGGYGIAILIMAVIGISSYLSTNKLIEAGNQKSQTYQVLNDLEGIISDMKDAETGQRGFLLTGKDSYLEPYSKAQDKAMQRLAELRKSTSDNPDDGPRLDAIKTQIDGKFSELAETIQARRNGDKGFQQALDIVLTDRGKNVMDDIRRKVDEMENDENSQLRTRTTAAASLADTAKSTIYYGLPLALVLMAAIGWVIVQNISAPLVRMTQAAMRISDGDLSVTLPVNNRGDEVGVLAKTFAIMVESLRRMTTDLTEGVNVLGSAAKEIAASSAQFASSSAETATAVTETTTTVEEVRQTSQVASQKAKNVSDAAQKMATTSLAGKKSTEETSQGMMRIREQMTSVAQSMVRLSEQGQAIGQIIATVDDLAQQSNLLAVNASIEAAKAGEQGKGFAVVAQEVKSLAEQSKQATAQVRTILNEVQKATNGAVMATDQGAKVVEGGVKQSAEAGESIMQLSNNVAEAAQAAQQIAASSQQQLVGMEQVVVAIGTIKQATTQNVDSARQLETAARNLNDLGQRLKDLVGKYKLAVARPA